MLRVGQGSSSTCSTDGKQQHCAHGRILLAVCKVLPRVQYSVVVYTSNTLPYMQFLMRIQSRASGFDRIINQNKYDRYACTVHLVPVDVLPTPNDFLVPPRRDVSTAFNPFRTAVPFWGQITQISSGLSPKRDSGPKRVKAIFRLNQVSAASTLTDFWLLCCCAACFLRSHGE